MNKLMDVINELGNALTALHWPAPTVPTIHNEKGNVRYNTANLYKMLMEEVQEVKKDRIDMRDCVNEMCSLCGAYKREHEGACDKCRWKKVKEGFM